jgi:hypothetical protein
VHRQFFSNCGETAADYALVGEAMIFRWWRRKKWRRKKESHGWYTRRDGTKVPYRPVYPVVAEADRRFIGDTIALFIANGLRPVAGVPVDELIDRVCEEAARYGYQDDGQPPKRWLNVGKYHRYQVLSLLADERETLGKLVKPPHSGPMFENARRFQDHCLDVAVDYYSSLVGALCAMSGGDLHFSDVEEHFDTDTKSVALTLKRHGEANVILLGYGKDVDWSILKTIGAYLVPGAVGRFGSIFDGGALVVYASPEQLDKLGTILDLNFWHEQA